LIKVVEASRLRIFFRMASKVAEALRRIQPELIPVSQSGEERVLRQIGGKLIPIHTQDVPDVYQQVSIT